MMALVVVVGLMASTACSGEDVGAESSNTTGGSSSASSVVAVTDAGTGGGGSGGCRAGGREPGGTVRASVVDVDGDGRRDEVWYATGPQRVGISTASGRVEARTVNSAKFVNNVLVINADQRGPIEVLIDNGGGIEPWTFLDCQLVPVTGPDSQPYLFDTGYRGNGTGATCTDLDHDGHRDLVGMNLQADSTTTPTTDYRLSRTIIDLDNATATHGHTDQTTIQTTPAQTSQYYGIRCGPLSLTAEMLTP